MKTQHDIYIFVKKNVWTSIETHDKNVCKVLLKIKPSVSCMKFTVLNVQWNIFILNSTSIELILT